MSKIESAQEWFTRFPDLGKDRLFQVRFKISNQSILITAWEGPVCTPYGHTRLYVEMKVAGKVLFPRENWYVGVSAGHSIDSDYAKELAVSLFCDIFPDSPDSEDDEYTSEQREWIEAHGEELAMMKYDRFGEF